jgi:hypothetical protein
MDDRCRLTKFCNSLKTKPKIRLKIRIKEVKNDTTFTAKTGDLPLRIIFASIHQLLESTKQQRSSVGLLKHDLGY